jgi:hypothetical protein
MCNETGKCISFVSKGRDSPVPSPESKTQTQIGRFMNLHSPAVRGHYVPAPDVPGAVAFQQYQI